MQPDKLTDETLEQIAPKQRFSKKFKLISAGTIVGLAVIVIAVILILPNVPWGIDTQLYKGESYSLQTPKQYKQTVDSATHYVLFASTANESHSYASVSVLPTVGDSSRIATMKQLDANTGHDKVEKLTIKGAVDARLVINANGTYVLHAFSDKTEYTVVIAVDKTDINTLGASAKKIIDSFTLD